jgi:hypothetical protein
VRWSAWFYAGVLLMPLGMVTAGGLWGSTAATLVTLGAFYGLYRLRGSGAPEPPSETRADRPSALAATGGSR